MADLKVLMLGPGDPSTMNSGLGIAAYEIAEHLQSRVELIILQPENQHTPLNQENSITTDIFDEVSVARDMATINIKTNIDPYFYASGNQVEIERGKSQIKEVLSDFSKKTFEEAKKLEFDLIYAHDWTTLDAAQKIKEFSKKPFVAHIHSLDYDRSSSLSDSWVFKLEKEALAKADHVIAVSQYTAGILQEHYQIDKHKISISHNAFIKSKRPKLKKVFPEKLILFVGRLTGQKGPAIFMEIAAKVHEIMPDTRFVMAGSGVLLKELIESGAFRSVSGKFHFTGQVDQEQMKELYAMADIYCMPSVSEPFGLSAIEAAGFEVPVVLSKQSGAAEVLAGALKANYWDVDKFVEHIIHLLKNEKIYQKVIFENNKALSGLTWEDTTEKVLRAFDQVKE